MQLLPALRAALPKAHEEAKKPAALLQRGEPHVLVAKAVYLPAGPEPLSDTLTAKFILTDTVRARLRKIARVLMTGKYPLLLQGTTSAGKTSLVEYLALHTGHKFVRINNHEHTELSEYLGAYVTDPRSGKLVFQEGVLVQAVRKGHWIVLDELNLAPSEVLEALNRLLDDNRELFLPETQEVIRPHPHFLLFATQNPAGGQYAGRKALSQAFRNRFVTMHVDDLPEAEVEVILQQRCGLSPSFGKAMISVQRELAKRREQQHVFAGKHSFMTPRDLFRWGERAPASWEQLVEDGFMLFGERLRVDDAKQVVKEVLLQSCKGHGLRQDCLDEVNLYSEKAVAKVLDALRVDMGLVSGGEAESNGSAETEAAIGKIAWTLNMRRLFVQVGRCLLYKEPVLAVGETGCGKTTVCQLFSQKLQQVLRVINCHQHTESSDFLGGLRPVRGKDKTAADIKAQVQQWFALYQQAVQASTDAAVTEAAAAADASTAEAPAASDVMADVDTDRVAVEASMSEKSPFVLAPVGTDATSLLASLSTPAGSASLSLPELLRAFHQYADPLSALDKQHSAARRKHEAALAEAEQARLELMQQLSLIHI